MKLMTFNIWNYTQPWERRRSIIASLITHERPDVVALQETRHDPRYFRGRNQGEQLAELTGYHPTWQCGQVYWPWPRVDEGVTILTPSAPLRVFRHELAMVPRERDDAVQRALLGVETDFEGQKVHVYDTHLSLSARARLRNAQQILTTVRRTSRDVPAFLMGDLNARPDEDAIQCLTGQGEFQGEGEEFVDCWTLAHPDATGYTYASFAPDHRIDYVLARRFRGRVTSARVIGDEAVDGVYASDHMGVVVEVNL